MNKIKILGININYGSKVEIMAKIKEFLASEKQHFIVTPNPEIILAAGEDEEFFDMLNKADLSLPDGVGLKIAAWLMGKNIGRVAGADLLKDILAIAEARNRGVVIFNWLGGLSNKSDIYQALARKYPKLRVRVFNVDREDRAPESAMAEADKFKPEIIFSTLGAPYQEKFIFYNLAKLPTAKIGLGVGGSFDFLTGRIKRAPKILRMIGLEWLWRLIIQPWRRRRIFNAVIIFPVKFIIYYFKNIFKITIIC